MKVTRARVRSTSQVDRTYYMTAFAASSRSFAKSYGDLEPDDERRCATKAADQPEIGLEPGDNKEHEDGEPSHREQHSGLDVIGWNPTIVLNLMPRAPALWQVADQTPVLPVERVAREARQCSDRPQLGDGAPTTHSPCSGSVCQCALSRRIRSRRARQESDAPRLQ